jgi:hypothetical protein
VIQKAYSETTAGNCHVDPLQAATRVSQGLILSPIYLKKKQNLAKK